MQQNVKFSFKNKTVLIVGGSKGIGKELASQYFKSGAKVYYLSRSKIKNKYNLIHFKCDLSKKNELINIEEKLRKLKKIDILINCAAINFAKKYNNISFKEWSEVIDLNLNSIFYITKIVLNKMRLKKMAP